MKSGRWESMIELGLTTSVRSLRSATKKRRADRNISQRRSAPLRAVLEPVTLKEHYAWLSSQGSSQLYNHTRRIQYQKSRRHWKPVRTSLSRALKGRFSAFTTGLTLTSPLKTSPHQQRVQT